MPCLRLCVEKCPFLRLGGKFGLRGEKFRTHSFYIFMCNIPDYTLDYVYIYIYILKQCSHERLSSVQGVTRRLSSAGNHCLKRAKRTPDGVRHRNAYLNQLPFQHW